MYDYPCKQERTSTNQEYDIISCYNIAGIFIIIQDKSNKEWEQHTADSTRHASQSYD